MLGGMCLNSDSPQYIAIPVPNGNINKIPINSLSKYFPKGFTILHNDKPFDHSAYVGILYSSFSGQVLCKPCSAEIHTFRESNLFDFYSTSYLYQGEQTIEGYQIDLYSYLDQYSSQSKSGSFMAVFSDFFIGFTMEIHALDRGYNNSISFTLDDKNQMRYSGNIYCIFNGQKGYYTFNGRMTPN